MREDLKAQSGRGGRKQMDNEDGKCSSFILLSLRLVTQRFTDEEVPKNEAICFV